jgi:serine/threonine protein kinase
VWRGLGCWPSSDVWSVGVTVSSKPVYCILSQLTQKLVHWLSPSIVLGAKDKIIEGLTEAWCIAKIMRLVGTLGPPVNPDYEEEFLIAKELESSTFEHPDTKRERQFIKVGTLRQELERLPGPNVSPDLINFIEYLLVVDHTKRPKASEALKHPYLQSSFAQIHNCSICI